MEGARSATSLVTLSVPQGSVLGPLLFSIYINDILEIGLSCDSQRVLYANDLSLYRPVTDPEDFWSLYNLM